jgi:hypothetical protein
VAAEHQGLAVTCPRCSRAVATPSALPVTQGADDEAARPPLGPSRGGDIRPPSIVSQLGQAIGGEPPVTDPQLRVQDVGGSRRIVAIGGQSYEIQQLTPEERQAFRRRVNRWIFGVSAVLLLLTMVALLVWRD